MPGVPSIPRFVHSTPKFGTVHEDRKNEEIGDSALCAGRLAAAQTSHTECRAPKERTGGFRVEAENRPTPPCLPLPVPGAYARHPPVTLTPETSSPSAADPLRSARSGAGRSRWCPPCFSPACTLPHNAAHQPCYSKSDTLIL